MWGLCVGLCFGIYYYMFFLAFFFLSIILTRKRELVALLLLSFGSFVTVNVPAATHLLYGTKQELAVV